jgi:hypothetical protein
VQNNPHGLRVLSGQKGIPVLLDVDDLRPKATEQADYTKKLTEILKAHPVKSVTIVRMEVPCCSGLESAAKDALKACGKLVPWRVVILSTSGTVLGG